MPDPGCRVARARGGRRLRAIAAVLLLALAALLFLFPRGRDQAHTLASVRQVDDYPLYVMRYHGDYGFDGYLSRGAQAGAGSPARQTDGAAWTCTCFASLSAEGKAIYGRNFDWYDHAALVVFTDPPGGYASVSMVDPAMAGVAGRGRSGLSWAERMRLVRAAPYLPLDGLNERSVAIGLMAVPDAEPGHDPQRVTIGGLQAIRLVLDHAASVEEAIALLGSYNLDFGGGPPLHYLVADAAGHAAVVEFVDGELCVSRNEGPWLVATNFTLCGIGAQDARSLCGRYQTAYDTLQQVEGALPQDEALPLLEAVSQGTTMWSAVYDMAGGELAVVAGGDFGRVHRFGLRMAGR